MRNEFVQPESQKITTPWVKLASVRRQVSLKEAPDGGYGWVVLAACSVGLFTVISTGRIGGLVFVEIVNQYKVSRTEAMTVLIVGRMFAFVAAPVAGKLLTKFDFSFILCLGSLVMSIALMLSSVTTAPWQLIITYGCILGIGSDFILVASTLVVGIYFKKRRSLAMGILYAVGCTGGFIMPVLFNYLVQVYSFNGALLVVGAICLHPAACGLLVRQPTWTNKANSSVKDYEFRPATTDSNENLNWSEPGLTKKETKTDLTLYQRSQSQVSFAIDEQSVSLGSNGIPKSVAGSESGMEDQHEKNGGIPQIKLNVGTPPEAKKDDQSKLFQRSHSQISYAMNEQIVLLDANGRPICIGGSDSSMEDQRDQLKRFPQVKPNVGTPPMMTKKDGKCKLGVPEICVVPKNERKSLNGSLPETEPFLVGPSDQELRKKSKFQETASSPSLLHQFIGSFKIFSDYLFIMLFVNRVLIMTCLLNFTPLIPDYVYDEVEAKITPQEVAFILSMMAVGDVIGRLCVGTLLDKLPWPNKHTFGGLSVGMGIILFALHWANSYSSLLIISVIYGFLLGSCVVVQFVLEVELMGVERAPKAHTISQFSIGIIATICGFIIGYMRDFFGSYQQGIHLLGGVSIASGLVWVLEPFLSRCLPPPPAPLVKAVTTASMIEPEEPPIR